jgi:UrcA family protein
LSVIITRHEEPKMYTKKALSFVFALATIGLVSMSQAAIADEGIDEIIVKAPVVQHQVDRTANGIKIDVIEVTAAVSFADLDLSKNADVQELMARIKDSANESCEELSEMFPLDMDRSAIQDCAIETSADTQRQLRAAIDAANPYVESATRSVR